MWKINHQSLPVEPAAESVAGGALDLLTKLQDIGFFDTALLKKGMEESLLLAKKFAGTEQVCVLGIGGSSLGGQALVAALAPEKLNAQILFFDNVDGKSFFRQLNSIKNPDKTLWILISKSGTTIETLSQAEFVEQFLQKKFKTSIAKRAVAITEKKSSALFDWAQKNNVPVLEVPLNIGGRFSALTPVGIFPLAVLGIDVRGLIDGANSAVEDKLAVDLVAQFSMSLARGELTTYFFSYCDDLNHWGQWLQQLWAESLGKKTNVGGKRAPPFSVPYACRGSTDQHSVLQQIAEGTQKKFVCFLRVEESEKSGEKLSTNLFSSKSDLAGKGLGELLRAEAIATQQALNENQIHSLTLIGEALNSQSMGFLMMSFELAVAALGIAHEINPFDQPGVERGKVLARSILSQQS